VSNYKDTGIIAMAANLVFNLILIFPLQHAGLALATSLSAFINAWLLLRGLRASGVYQSRDNWPGLLLKVLLACSAMSLVLIFATPPLAEWLEQGIWYRAWQLLLWIVLGASTYLGILLLLGLSWRDFRART